MSIPNKQLIGATGQTVVGSASDTRSGKFVLQISGTFSCSMVPKVILRGGSLASNAGQNVAYVVQKTGVLTDGATTAITTAGAYVVSIEAGQLLILDATYTSGSVVVESIASPLA